MLAILSAVFGFAAPFLPQIFKLFQQRQDNAHELAMAELRMRAAEKEHLWRMEEINAQADIAEAAELHRPQQSFGVQILDAAKASGFGPWAIVPAFYLFTLLDFLAGMVRPSVTYAAFGFYIAYKWACYWVMMRVTVDMAWTDAVARLWGEHDWAILTLVLSYYFGLRSYKAVFGGSASTALAGR